jgi:hypothetical protein
MFDQCASPSRPFGSQAIPQFGATGERTFTSMAVSLALPRCIQGDL